MIREIKFRKWSKRTSTMEYDVFPPVKDALMQFTGYKTRKGNEIYEGDIITMTAANGNWTEYRKVVWFESGWHLKWNEEYNNLHDEMTMYDGDLYDLEIVGNIYESDKSLIKKAK